MILKEQLGFSNLAKLSLLLLEEGFFKETYIFILAYTIVKKICNFSISTSIYKVQVK